MPTVNSKTLLAMTAVSTLTALGLAIYIACLPSENERPGASSLGDDENEKCTSSVPETVIEVKKEMKKRRHPLEVHDSAYGGCVYLDYNGTTPVYTEVFESMEPYFTLYFGNPSSSHLFGPTSKRAIELARFQVAKLISCTAPYDEIIFTGCGTESDNRAIDIAIYQYLNQRGLSMRTCPDEMLPEVVTSPIEHPAVLCYLRQLKIQGMIKLHILPVNSEGFVTLSEVEKVLTKNTALVTIMHSNNEVGTLQPIRAISRVIQNFNRRERTKILFHSDAAQSVGKIPIDVHFLGVDLLTIVGHKYGAPKGIAILYARRNTVTDVPPMLVGGGQEKGRRGGTENVPYIVGLGTASSYASKHLLENILHLLSLKLYFLSSLQTTLQAQGWTHLVKFNGPKRSVHYQQLQDDMKVLKLLFQSNAPTSSSSAASSPTPPTPPTPSTPPPPSPSTSQHPPHHPHNHQRVYVPENTAADVLEQLPNTISVSFKGLIGHEIVSELGNKVACSAGSACHTVPTTTTSAVSQPATGTLISNDDSSILIMHTEDHHNNINNTLNNDNNNNSNNAHTSNNSMKSNSSSSSSNNNNNTNNNAGFDYNNNAYRLSMEENKPQYTVSEVLQAMHVSEDYGLGTVRLSCGRYTTNEDIDVAVRELLRVVCTMWKKKGIIIEK